MLYVLVGIILMTLIGIISYVMRFVDISGFLSGMVIGITIWLFGGVGPFLLVLSFFVVSGLATKYKYKKKKTENVAQEHRGRRSWHNVVGSGIIPAILTIIMFVVQSIPYWYFIAYVAFASSVATTTADTLASEIGVLSKKRPRMITSWTRTVPRGTRGAVSGLGLKVELYTASILGLFSGLFFLFGIVGWGVVVDITMAAVIVPLVAFVGFVGANLDSLIGAISVRHNLKITGNMVNLGSSTLGGILGIMTVTGLLGIVAVFFVTWIIISGSS